MSNTIYNYCRIFAKYNSKNKDQNKDDIIYKMINDWTMEEIPEFIDIEKYKIILENKLDILHRLENNKSNKSNKETRQIINDFIKGEKYSELRHLIFQSIFQGKK